MSTEDLVVVFVALAAGGLTKGLTGLGLPMVSIPIMAGFLGVERAVLILIVPIVVLNLWLAWVNRDCVVDVPELPRLLIPGLPGAALGASVLYLASDRVLATILAVWIVGYLLLRLLHPNLTLSQGARRRAAPAVGFAAGAMQAATGISAPIVAAYVDALGLSPRSYVFAVAAIFTALTGAHLIVLVSVSAYSLQQLLESTLAVIPALIFMRPGVWLRSLIAPSVFTGVIRVLLALMALRLLYGAWVSA
ncbi:MAG TPA: sulfite exporter TauE/SafE family protein [Gammaproteobacteria bacterium]|jgi:hypothetical protein